MKAGGRKKKKKSSSWHDDKLKSSQGHFVSVWIPYYIFMSCHGLLNINSASHHVRALKLSFCRPADPLSLFIGCLLMAAETCLPPAPSYTLIWWSLCGNVNTVPAILSWRLVIFISTLRYDVASPQSSRPARCHTFNSFGARVHVHGTPAPGGNCLISSSFNYLPFPPLGRSEGLRVNERRIDNQQDDQLFCDPPPPSASSVPGERSDRVCWIVHAHKMKSQPVQTAVVHRGNRKFFGKRAKTLLFWKWRILKYNWVCCRKTRAISWIKNIINPGCFITDGVSLLGKAKR